MSVSSKSGVLVLLAVIAGLTSACNKGAPSSAPGGGYPDDVTGLEAALADNAQRLQAEGIAVDDARPNTKASPALEAGDEQRDNDDAAGGESAEATTPPEPTASEPDPDPAPAPARAPEEENDLELSQDEDRFKSDGLDRRRERAAEADRCERICDLAAATCDLADHICTLARRHPDEPRYDDACARATNQCDAAAAVCRECANE